MPERTSITQVVQVGIETTPGTAVAANRFLPSMMIDVGIEGGLTEQRGSGNKFPVNYITGKENSVGKLSGNPTYDEILYYLVSCINYAAGVQNGATTAYTWTLSPASTAEDTAIKTLTVEMGSAVRAHKFARGQINELVLSGSRDSIDLSGNLIGQLFTDGITLTASPTAVPQIPIVPKHVDVFMDDTSAGLGTTKLTRLLNWEVGVRNRFAPLWVVDSSQTSYTTSIETAIDASVKLKMMADAQGMGLLTAARSVTKKFIRIVATSDQNAGVGFPYKLQWDVCAEVKTFPNSIADQDGVYAIEWEMGLVHDTTWGKAMSIALTNTRVTL